MIIIGDVTRWQAEHSWREQPAESTQSTAEYFPPLPEQKTNIQLKLNETI